MKFLNSPIVTCIVLSLFIWLDIHTYMDRPRVAVPESRQEGYSKNQIDHMSRFVAFKIKEMPIESYKRQDIKDLFGREGVK